jgi:cellulose biosynthesis protein BcsQ
MAVFMKCCFSGKAAFMKTILVTSQKGGSSKSMLVSHLAVEAERAGDGPAWVIDTDRQGTLSRWHERRQADTPMRGDVRFEKLKDGLAKLAEKDARYCFIDTAPTISTQTAALIDLADFILIPVRPSPADLWAVTAPASALSAGMAKAWTPKACAALPPSLARSGELEEVSATLAPSRASRLTMAAPMPRLPPVTRAHWFFRV